MTCRRTPSCASRVFLVHFWSVHIIVHFIVKSSSHSCYHMKIKITVRDLSVTLIELLIHMRDFISFKEKCICCDERYFGLKDYLFIYCSKRFIDCFDRFIVCSDRFISCSERFIDGYGIVALFRLSVNCSSVLWVVHIPRGVLKKVGHESQGNYRSEVYCVECSLPASLSKL